MVEEVAVDRDRRFAVLGLGQGLGGFEEVGAGRLGAGLARLEEKQVDDDVGAGLDAHGARRKSDGTDEVSPLPEIRPCRLVGLVHRPAADDEGTDSAGPEVGERTGDEGVVQRKRKPPVRLGHAHRTVGERGDMFCRTYPALCCGQIYVAKAPFVRGRAADLGLLTQHI